MKKKVVRRRPPRAIFMDVEQLTSKDIEESDILRVLLNKEIPLSIREAIDYNKTYATVFEINDSSNYIEIKRDQWKQALEWCLAYYVEIEDYYTCSEIKSMMDKLTKN